MGGLSSLQKGEAMAQQSGSLPRDLADQVGTLLGSCCLGRERGEGCALVSFFFLLSFSKLFKVQNSFSKCYCFLFSCDVFCCCLMAWFII